MYLLKKDLLRGLPAGSKATGIVGRIAISATFLQDSAFAFFEPYGKSCQTRRAVNFGGRNAEECIENLPDGVNHIIRIKQLDGLNWEDTNGIQYYINNNYSDFAPTYSKILSTFKFMK